MTDLHELLSYDKKPSIQVDVSPPQAEHFPRRRPVVAAIRKTWSADNSRQITSHLPQRSENCAASPLDLREANFRGALSLHV